MIRTTLRGSVLKRMVGATVLALASAGAAHAAVITFEGQTGTALNQGSFQEQGYTVTYIDPGLEAPPSSVLIGRYIDGSAGCAPDICPSNNPSTYLELFNTGYASITATNGAAFRFSGLDASFIASLGTNYPGIPAAVQVFGFRDEVSDPDIIQFNISDTVEFQSFNAADVENGGEFAQQDYLEIAIVGLSCNFEGLCNGLDNSAGQIGVDNILLSDLPVNNVPEPASAALLALGLLGMGARARRRS